jgi:GMP synthase (glutamine-hydrolysing)
MNDLIVILDFGSQYTQLIARRLRELNHYCEIYPYNKFPSDIAVKAVILSGSPYSVLDDNALPFDVDLVLNKYPVLGICYGAQLLAHNLGGKVLKSKVREYGKSIMSVIEGDLLFDDVDPASQVWMSHGDSITQVPNGFEIIAKSNEIVAAFRSESGKYQFPVYGIQFHPEVTHSLQGLQILDNFVNEIAGCTANWTPASMVSETVHRLQTTLGDDHVMMGLSGGVDSTVAATLLHKAIGDRLHCIFVDNGLLRKGEYEEVLQSYEGMGLNITGIRANLLFLDALKGITDPEQKRKTIGRLFIEVFEAASHELPQVKWLGQGTIYPDVIESVSVSGPSVTIKSHHNVGGLPEKLKLSLVEPLRMLFKDEVRKVGAELGIPNQLLQRHPFPGPGLGIRVLGEVNSEKVRLCQEADKIYTDHLRQSGWYEKVWQAGAILLPVQSVGVMGDERTYEYTVALRCVNSIDGMTAEWSHLPYDLLSQISIDIINKVKGINRVVYDISTKPPATIEWE